MHHGSSRGCLGVVWSLSLETKIKVKMLRIWRKDTHAHTFLSFVSWKSVSRGQESWKSLTETITPAHSCNEALGGHEVKFCTRRDDACQTSQHLTGAWNKLFHVESKRGHTVGWGSSVLYTRHAHHLTTSLTCKNTGTVHLWPRREASDPRSQWINRSFSIINIWSLGGEVATGRGALQEEQFTYRTVN